jgi:APA family basic amino acid/polyamine antiporter
MLSSLLVFQYGQARIWFAMSRDGLLPKMFSKVHPVHKTPHISAWIAGLVGVTVLRKTQLDLARGFRVPGGGFLPIISIVFCLVLMMALPLETWVRFFVWLLIGFAI